MRSWRKIDIVNGATIVCLSLLCYMTLFYTEYSNIYNLKHNVTIHSGPPKVIANENYIQRIPISRPLVIGDEFSKWQPKSHHLTQVKEYFEYLHTAQGNCRKLVRLGGTISCHNSGDDKNMDGHKLVCFDPELELPGGRSPNDCLVFSYGVFNDITFDEAVSLLPCEIHMFDIVNYKPSVFLDETPHAHFHKTGIGPETSAKFFIKMNETIMMDTLVKQVVKYKLIGRPMHILKMDVENGEWKIFKSLKGNPFLNLVGQIALEVHADDLANSSLTTKEHLKYSQERYDVLREIENQGFRMVAYWDNHHQKKAYYDELGNRHDVFGELLYVNTNWYNATFKETLRTTYGFEFKAPSLKTF